MRQADWFTRPPEGVKKRADKQEKDVAKRLGGHRVAGSGNKWYAPGDVVKGACVGDAKFTDHSSYSLTTQTWNKIREDCFARKGEIPFLQIEMKGCEPLVVLSEETFRMFLSYMEKEVP